MATIYKSALLCVRDRKVLFARSAKNKDIFYLPGGKREAGETNEAALVREIEEELAVTIDAETIAVATTFTDHAHGKPADVMVEIVAYTAAFSGEPKPTSEIVELAWFTSRDIDSVYGVGKQAITWLHEQYLID